MVKSYLQLLNSISDNILIESVTLGYKYIFESINSNMIFLHGGNLDSIQSIENFHNWTKGRIEYGPGLYLTTQYDTAINYAKGSRKLYKIEVEQGTDINTVSINALDIQSFIPSILSKPQQKIFNEYANKRIIDGKLKAYIFVNILINNNLISSKNGSDIRQFLVNNGVDYDMIQHPFGTDGTMLVLYNMKKIKNIQRVSPSDSSIMNLPDVK
jgi:hypothetical protein